MVLTNPDIKKINDFVSNRPRTIQEIAHMLGKNWRTADAYVERIAREQGTIAVRTFREGTRGALKIAYWQSVENVNTSQAKERLFKDIERGKTKKYFSPFDMYQHIDDDMKSVKAEERSKEEDIDIIDLIKRLQACENQLLSFSGNLSYINLKYDDKNVLDLLEKLALRNVTIRLLCRVDIPAMRNIEKVLAINEKLGRNAIEIRHCHHPVRGVVIDDKVIRLKEILDPKDFRQGELDVKTLIFYEMFDEDWIVWMQKVFWNLWRSSIPAEQRIAELKKILLI